MQDLIPIENAQPAALFAPGGLDPLLARIAEEARALVPDTSTKKGRDAIASNAHKVARSKTYLEEIGKGYAAEIKELPKRVDAERRRVRDFLQSLQDEVRAPLTAWERAEAALQAEADALILLILSGDLGAMSSAELRAKMENLATFMIPANFTDQQKTAIEVAVGQQALALQKALSAAVTREAEAAEAARIQAEIAEKARLEREEQIQQEAKEAAEREILARTARVQLEAEEARAAAARAAAEQEANIERTRRETEQRIAAENAAKAREVERQAQEERAARETAERKKECHRQALDSILAITDLEIEDGKALVRAIVQGRIANVRFYY